MCKNNNRLISDEQKILQTISLQDYVKRLWNHSNTKIPVTIGKGTDTPKPRSKAPHAGQWLPIPTRAKQMKSLERNERITLRQVTRIYHWFRSVQLHFIISKSILSVDVIYHRCVIFVFQIWIFYELRDSHMLVKSAWFFLSSQNRPLADCQVITKFPQWWSFTYNGRNSFCTMLVLISIYALFFSKWKFSHLLQPPYHIWFFSISVRFRVVCSWLRIIKTHLYSNLVSQCVWMQGH